MGTFAGENQAGAASTFARHVIARPRLIHLLEETEAPVRVLSAPPGYGKTTLARQWLGSGRRAAWYQASPASADVAALAAGLASAAAQLIEGVGSLVRERVRANRRGEADPDLLADALLTEISDWPADAWLTVDDYQHVMESSAAERFIERLAHAPNMHLLLLTRRRPSWLTARQLMYGEVCEVGVHALAMTQDEAALVLKSARNEAVSGLVALAQGWPAVIGLAALTAPSLNNLENQLPEALHSYFAEELYQALDERLRRALLGLSLAPTITPALATTLFGPGADTVIEDATRFGFLVRFGEGGYDLHPLLRQFLRSKVEPRDEDLERWCGEICTFLLSEEAWDDMFSLLQERPSTSGFDSLVEGALGRFLHDGRVETVRRWVKEAGQSNISSPLLDLAAAEVLFREGRHRDAEDFALRAARGFAGGHKLRSRALYRAAQSAQLDNRADAAIPRHVEAAKIAVDALDRRNAIWGQFVAHAELDNRDQALQAAAEYERTSSPSADDRLRQAHAKVSVAIRWGGIREALDQCRQCVALLEERADPLIQTAFSQMVASAFVLAAEYDEALNVATLEEMIAARVGLDFVIPHVWITRATAYIGQREFRKSRKWLDASFAKAEELGDDHSRINVTMLQAKLMLAQLNAERACDTLDRAWNSWPTRALGAEYLAMQAFANACAGDGDEVLARIAESSTLSSQIEADALRIWANAIVSHRHEGNTRELVAAFEHSYAIGHVDSVILAYRSYSPTLSVLATDRHTVPRLKEILTAGRDRGPAKRVGIRLTSSEPELPSILTQRELDVVALLHEGLSNAQIAKALWISESTAKVHVRHILRKLGVRTRTEAAVRAAKYLA